MEVWLYNWSKKDNSTARPDPAANIVVTGTVKGAVSITAPVISFENPANNTWGTKLGVIYNYAYIPSFHRYYWVTNKVIDQTGLITLSFTVDPLATLGDSIRGLTTYVSRSSALYNGDFADGAYVAEATPHIIRNDISGYAPAVLSSGCFVIGTSSPVSTGITYWYFEQAAFKTLVNVLNDPIALCKAMGHNVDNSGILLDLADSIKGLTAEMYVSLYNPVQFIRSVVFYPKPPAFQYGAAVAFRLGDITFNISGATVAAYPMLDLSLYGTYGLVSSYGGNQITVNVPKHPQVATRGAYLEQPPYSQYRMSVPGYGTFEIDGAKLHGVSKLYLKIATDFRDGSGVLYIDSNVNRWGEIAQIHGKSGITWELGQRSADYSTSSLMVGAITSGLNVAGNLIGKSGKTDAVAAVPETTWSGNMDKINEMYGLGDNQWGIKDKWAFGWKMVGQQQQKSAESYLQTGSTIKDTVSSFIDGIRPVTHMSFVGSAGTLAEFLAEGFLELYYFNMANERYVDIGRPLNSEQTLGDLSGFVMCVNPHVVSNAATKPEVDAVNAALESGIILDWSNYS